MHLGLDGQLGWDEAGKHRATCRDPVSFLLLENNQIHEQQFLKAVDFALAATLADIAAGIGLDVVGGFTAGEAEAGIVVLETPVFLFGENRLDERFATARLKRLRGHSVE